MGKFNQSDFNNNIIQKEIIGFFEKAITLKSGRKSNYYINWRNIANDAYLLDKLSDFVLDFTNDLGIKTDCFFGVPEGATKLGLITQYKANPNGNILTNNLNSVPIDWLNEKSELYTKDLDPEKDSILGNPFGNISKELAVIAQYNLTKQSDDFSDGKFILPYMRKKAKGHGETQDENFVGTPDKSVRIITEHSAKTDDLYARLKSLKIPVRDIAFIDEKDILYRNNPDSVTVLEDVTTTGGSLIEIINNLKGKNINTNLAIGLSNRCERRDDGYSVREIIESMGKKYEQMSKSTDLLPLAYEKNKPSSAVVDALNDQFKKYGIEKFELV